MATKKDEIIKALTEGNKTVEEIAKETGSSERWIYQVQSDLDKVRSSSGMIPESVFGVGKDLLKLGKTFGIEEKDVGHMLLKSMITGKGGIGDLFKENKTSRSKIEKYIDGIKSLIPYVWGSNLLYHLLKWVGVWIA